MATATNSIPKLPYDIVLEILSRLPVKSLLKFRCVSKSWDSLISSYQFSKTHLRNTAGYTKLTHQRIMLNCRGNLKHCSSHSLFYEPLIDAIDTDYLFLSSRKLVWVVVSCDGLICLAVDRKDLILWNPSTRKYKQLPDFGAKTSFGTYFAYGLGFDKHSDDYKVVGFNSNRDLSEVIVKVYSLRTNQWKSVKNYKGRWLMDDPATFANGKLHWIANSGLELESGWDIASFDLETEEYGVLKMPNYVENGFYSRLGASEGCLYVLCSHLTRADVWIMEGCELGKGTLTKLVSIPYIDDFLRYTYKKLMYVMKNGEILLLCGLKFVVFNTNECTFKYPEIRTLGDFVAATTYVESLVSPFM